MSGNGLSCEAGNFLNGLKVNFSTVEDVAELREIDAEFEEMRGRHRKQVALIADKKVKLAKLIALCAASPDDPDKIRQPKRDIVELELVIESERRVLESIDASISRMAKRSSERSGWILSDCRSQVSTNALDELEECKNAIHAQMRLFYLLYFAAHGS